VSVVYFRAGYMPTDYPGGPGGAEWAARATLECSRAVKCPSVGYHLAGSKKVQQCLAQPGVLERFLPDRPADVAALRACFVGLWGLGPRDAADARVRAAVADAVARPERYVLKPQREGGGNNLYGAHIARALCAFGGGGGGDAASAAPAGAPAASAAAEEGVGAPLDLASFVLMERIFPTAAPAVFVRAGRAAPVAAVVSELGVYGAFLGDGRAELLNEEAGYLLRTNAGMSVDSRWSVQMALTNAAPIPEPTTTALLLAGLAALGWLARRRG
jgi:glutathione synthase